MLISWIIPMYNCAPYIARCIDSLLEQGLQKKDFEIIVINDGSTDGGEKKVQEYSEKHTNIRLFNQPNRGVGAARNRGLLAAKGQYIHFVDADDYLAKGSVLRLYGTLCGVSPDNWPDVLLFDEHRIKGSGSMPIAEAECKITYHGSIIGYVNNHGIHPSCCNKWLKRQTIADLKFSDYPIGEDLDFIIRLYSKPGIQVIKCNLTAYCYCVRSNSAMGKKENAHLSKVIKDYIKIFTEIKNGVHLTEFSDPCIEDFLQTHVRCLILVKLLSGKFSYRELRKYLRRLRQEGITPLPKKPNLIAHLLSFSSSNALAFWLLSKPYRNLYLKYWKYR